MLIVFDDVIADMLCTKNLNPIVTELFIKGRQLNISESYFAIPKNKTTKLLFQILNEIRQTIYSLYREKEVTKKVYNNLMNSIKL